MAIDIFSKYGWAVPFRFNTGPEATEAFKSQFTICSWWVWNQNVLYAQCYINSGSTFPPMVLMNRQTCNENWLVITTKIDIDRLDLHPGKQKKAVNYDAVFKN